MIKEINLGKFKIGILKLYYYFKTTSGHFIVTLVKQASPPAI